MRQSLETFKNYEANIFATRSLGCEDLRQALSDRSAGELLQLVVGSYQVSHQALDLRAPKPSRAARLYISCEACSRVKFVSGCSGVLLEVETIDPAEHEGSHFRLVGSKGELLVECQKIYLSR